MCNEMDDAIFVSCDNDDADASVKHIVGISMYGNSLNGTLPSSLAGLPKLKLISVLENTISGSLDESLCSLSYLEWIRVGGFNIYAALGGGIPSCLFVLPGVKGIWLRNTQLGGTAPTTLASTLVELGLEGNNLTGALPSFNYSQLQMCNLKNNGFSCPLPADAEEKCGATCQDVLNLPKETRTSWSCQCASSPTSKGICYTRWRCCTDSSMSTCDETVAWGDKPECSAYCDEKSDNSSFSLFV